MKSRVLIMGTSSGIGKASAILFAKKEWNVIATMRTPDSAHEFTGFDNVLVTRLDVQDQTSEPIAIPSQGIGGLQVRAVLIESRGTWDSAPEG